MKTRMLSGSTLAALIVGALYTLPAAALTCQPGEEAYGEPPQCIKKGDIKPQLDVEKYSGSQKSQAEACNKSNAARTVIRDSGDEIERLNNSINAAQHEVQDAKGADKDAPKAKVAELKAQRKAEEKKLKQAQADELAAKKAYRKATKQVKKDKGTSLNCI